MTRPVVSYALTGWWAVAVLLLAYWIGMEDLDPGQQYADPLLPCVWLGAIFGIPVGVFAAALTRQERS